MAGKCPKCGGELVEKKLEELTRRRLRGRRDFEYENLEFREVLICSQCGRVFPLSEFGHPEESSEE